MKESGGFRSSGSACRTDLLHMVRKTSLEKSAASTKTQSPNQRSRWPVERRRKAGGDGKEGALRSRGRLDLLLVDRQRVTSREDGRRRVLAGEVLVNDLPVTKAGVSIDISAEIRLRSTSPYVSRGGLKLEKALREFAILIKDKTALDIGASTGGFT